MKGNTYFSAFVGLLGAASAVLLTSTPAVSQFGAPKANVALQPTTPGTSQSGHANISGTLKAGTVNANTFLGGSFNGSFVTGNTLSSGAVVTGQNLSPAAGSIGVLGRATAPANSSIGVVGEALGTNGVGVYGHTLTTSGNTIGVYGASDSAAGMGVYGVAISTIGTTYGVYGSHAATGGAGVYGSSADNVGVWGSATGAAGANWGVYATSSSISGRGVSGIATASTGITYGGYFLSNSPTGYAAYAVNLATGNAGDGIGLYAESNQVNGSAIRALADDATGVNLGLEATSDGLGGKGVFASTTYTGTGGVTHGVWGSNHSALGRGVYGLNSAATSGYGVYGQNPNASGFGVYSAGDFGASGTKAFVIDHPLDPENKYLKHYCSEGPEPQNVYNGTVQTGADGYVTVELPSYYESINKDARIQLTVLDDSDDFVMVKATMGVKDGEFRIRTSKPNVTVFWEVRATRNDLWMRAHPHPAEIDKPEGERGLVQHPELMGLSPDRGLNYQELQQSRLIRSRPRPQAPTEKPMP